MYATSFLGANQGGTTEAELNAWLLFRDTSSYMGMTTQEQRGRAVERVVGTKALKRPSRCTAVYTWVLIV